MIKVLRQIDPTKYFYIDIETRGQEQKFNEEGPLGDYMDYTFRNKADFKQFETMDEAYEARCGLYSELGAICTISIGFINGDKIKVTSFYGEDEKSILRQFKLFLDNQEGGRFKALCGFASNGFDIPFIIHRMMANGIFDIPSILDETDAKPWEKKNLDLKMDLNFSRYNSLSLIGLCTILGVKSPKEGIEGSQVNEEFWKGNHEDIKDYCERDVVTVANCLLKVMGREVLEYDSVVAPKYEDKEEFQSFLDEFALTGDVDLKEMSKEVAQLTKKEQEIYFKLVEIVK